jgi:hypothetical protein
MIKAYIYLERVQIPFSKVRTASFLTGNSRPEIGNGYWKNTTPKKKPKKFSKTTKLYPTSNSSQHKLKISIKPTIQT